MIDKDNFIAYDDEVADYTVVILSDVSRNGVEIQFSDDRCIRFNLSDFHKAVRTRRRIERRNRRSINREQFQMYVLSKWRKVKDFFNR